MFPKWHSCMSKPALHACIYKSSVTDKINICDASVWLLPVIQVCRKISQRSVWLIERRQSTVQLPTVTCAGAQMSNTSISIYLSTTHVCRTTKAYWASSIYCISKPLNGLWSIPIPNPASSSPGGLPSTINTSSKGLQKIARELGLIFKPH